MDREPRRTLVLAEMALNQIKALSLPADPPSFELWYSYAGAQNPQLNDAVNRFIREHGSISITDLDRIYEQFLSPSRFADSAEKIGLAIADETDQIVDLIEAAMMSSASLRQDLAAAHQELGLPVDRETIRAVVETLLDQVKGMEERANKLEDALHMSRGAIGALMKELEQARLHSNTDVVTSLPNRRHFDQTLKSAVSTASEKGSPFSLLLLDIDHFKSFNDAHGHQTGDDVLRLMGRTLQEILKDEQFAARIGGEEFAIILPETSLAQAQAVAENVRAAIMSREVRRRTTRETLGRITVSIGVAEREAEENGSALMERADRHLSRAKAEGRNKVVWEAEPSKP